MIGSKVRMWMFCHFCHSWSGLFSPSSFWQKKLLSQFERTFHWFSSIKDQACHLHTPVHPVWVKTPSRNAFQLASINISTSISISILHQSTFVIEFGTIYTGINAPNFWGAWGGYREILRSVRRLCEKVVRGRLQEFLSELKTMFQKKIVLVFSSSENQFPFYILLRQNPHRVPLSPPVGQKLW